jgi:hypothetical protein
MEQEAQPHQGGQHQRLEKESGNHGKTPSYTCGNEGIFPGCQAAGISRRLEVHDQQLRTQRTHIIVYARGYFEIFETLRFVQMVLQLPSTVQEQLHAWLAEHLDQIQKRE